MSEVDISSLSAGSSVAPVEAVALYAEFTAMPGAGDTVAELIGDYAHVVRAESGTVVFDVYRRDEQPDRFFVFEVYRDRAAFEAHIGAPAGGAFNRALGPLIVEDGSRLSFLRPVSRA